MITINYNTIRGYKTLETTRVKDSVGENTQITREARFAEGRRLGMEVSENCYDTDIFTVILDQGANNGDIRAYTPCGRMV